MLYIWHHTGLFMVGHPCKTSIVLFSSLPPFVCVCVSCAELLLTACRIIVLATVWADKTLPPVEIQSGVP